MNCKLLEDCSLKNETWSSMCRYVVPDVVYCDGWLETFPTHSMQHRSIVIRVADSTCGIRPSFLEQTTLNPHTKISILILYICARRYSTWSLAPSTSCWSVLSFCNICYACTMPPSAISLLLALILRSGVISLDAVDLGLWWRFLTVVFMFLVWQSLYWPDFGPNDLKIMVQFPVCVCVGVGGGRGGEAMTFFSLPHRASWGYFLGSKRPRRDPNSIFPSVF